jgi:biotin synthase
MTYSQLAAEVLRGKSLTREEALSLLHASDDDLLPLLEGAFRLRRARFGRGVLLHVIRNAKSGDCTENCAYCSQSADADTAIPRYPLESTDELLSGARDAHRAGAVRYCMVTSGRRVAARELARICEATRLIKAELPLAICVSLGTLDDESAHQLSQAGVDRYNHNLETSARHFPAICQSHGFEDRLATARRAKTAGMELCSGALLGMGETLEDRVDVAWSLRSLEVDSVPVNFLDPRPGTRLEGTQRLNARDALRALAMFRFALPNVELRVAGGRERILGPMQTLALYPANSLFTSGYLTTGGQGLDADIALIEGSGFHVSGLAE